MLRQICQLIPTHRVEKLARETGANYKARTFTRVERSAHPQGRVGGAHGRAGAAGLSGADARVTAWVEVDGEERVMVFLTNNTAWAASSVVDLYGCRWSIEAFFKELKQTVQLVDFLGHYC